MRTEIIKSKLPEINIKNLKFDKFAVHNKDKTDISNKKNPVINK